MTSANTMLVAGCPVWISKNANFKKDKPMEKGTSCKIVVRKDILVGSPNTAPTRFLCGEVVRGTFETTTADGGACFHIEGVGDFVFFPPNAIAYEEMVETSTDLARRCVVEKRKRDLEDPREWASNLAEDITDADD